MKVKKIYVENYKAVKQQELDLNGCSAIVMAGNDQGKTSVLRGLIDRFHGEKPDLIVKQGENKGVYELELMDGSMIIWSFTEKTENIKYITKEGFEVKTGVLKMLGEKYFGVKFDIDKFLKSGPKEQVKELQRLVGLDFSEIDREYKEAYDARTEANREVSRLRAMNMPKPEEVNNPNLESIQKELEEKRKKNDEKYQKWQEDNERHLQKIDEFNKAQDIKQSELDSFQEAYETLLDFKDGSFDECIDFEKAKKVIESFEQPKGKKTRDPLPKPPMDNISIIEDEYRKAQDQYKEYINYVNKVDQYNQWIKDGQEAAKEATKWQRKIEDIESRRKEMINSANIPDEFEINNEGIFYQGYPLDENQISTSGKYIAALKLGSLVLGEIRTLHFDASFLDKHSLSEVQEWAKKNELQLLIERPEFEGGEITYEIISNE